MALEGALLGAARAECKNFGCSAQGLSRICSQSSAVSLNLRFRCLEKLGGGFWTKSRLRNSRNCGRLSCKDKSLGSARLWAFRARALGGRSSEEPDESQNAQEGGNEAVNGADIGGGKTEGGKWKEITSSVAQFSRDFWTELKNFQAELVSGKVEWNGQKAAAALIYALIVGAFLRGAYMAVYSRTLGKQKMLNLTDKYLESIIPEPTPRNIRRCGLLHSAVLVA